MKAIYSFFFIILLLLLSHASGRADNIMSSPLLLKAAQAYGEKTIYVDIPLQGIFDKEGKLHVIWMEEKRVEPSKSGGMGSTDETEYYAIIDKEGKELLTQKTPQSVKGFTKHFLVNEMGKGYRVVSTWANPMSEPEHYIVMFYKIDNATGLLEKESQIADYRTVFAGRLFFDDKGNINLIWMPGSQSIEVRFLITTFDSNYIAHFDTVKTEKVFRERPRGEYLISIIHPEIAAAPTFDGNYLFCSRMASRDPKFHFDRQLSRILCLRFTPDGEIIGGAKFLSLRKAASKVYPNCFLPNLDLVRKPDGEIVCLASGGRDESRGDLFEITFDSHGRLKKKSTRSVNPSGFEAIPEDICKYFQAGWWPFEIPKREGEEPIWPRKYLDEEKRLEMYFYGYDSKGKFYYTRKTVK